MATPFLIFKTQIDEGGAMRRLHLFGFYVPRRSLRDLLA
jgi:hypothetical protein